jgi:hypothetical protein
MTRHGWLPSRESRSTTARTSDLLILPRLRDTLAVIAFAVAAWFLSDGVARLLDLIHHGAGNVR